MTTNRFLCRIRTIRRKGRELQRAPPPPLCALFLSNRFVIRPSVSGEFSSRILRRFLESDFLTPLRPRFKRSRLIACSKRHRINLATGELRSPGENPFGSSLNLSALFSIDQPKFQPANFVRDDKLSSIDSFSLLYFFVRSK